MLIDRTGPVNGGPGDRSPSAALGRMARVQLTKLDSYRLMTRTTAA